MLRSTGNTCKVAAYGQGGRGRGSRGRGRGRGRGSRGRDRSRVTSRRANNIPDKIVVDGKELYPFKSYSNNEYQELNSNQRNKLRKACLRNRSNSMDNRSISAAINEGIREALSANNESASTVNVNGQMDSVPTQVHDEINMNVSSTISTSTSTDQFRNRRKRH